MKKILLAILMLGCFAQIAVAADSPEDVVTKMVADLKKDGGPLGVINYVHWQTAFDGLPEQEKKGMGVNTPEELKTFYQNLYTDPSAFFQKQMTARMGNVPAEQQAAMKAQMDQMSAQMKEKFAKAKEDIKKTDFEITNSKIDGDKAVVHVSTTLDGAKKEDDINLIKIDDKWYLPSLLQGKEPSKEQAPVAGKPATPAAQD
jgi:Domain of unknown function (DUF4878)